MLAPSDCSHEVAVGVEDLLVGEVAFKVAGGVELLFVGELGRANNLKEDPAGSVGGVVVESFGHEDIGRLHDSLVRLEIVVL